MRGHPGLLLLLQVRDRLLCLRRRGRELDFIAKLDPMHQTGSPLLRKVYTFNLGNLKRDRREPIMPPQFEVRDGTINEEMRAGTLEKLKQVLSTGNLPARCIFIVHGHKDQIEGMAQ